MSNVTIKRNHEARNRIAELPSYFDSKGHALSAIDSILADHGMTLGYGDCTGGSGQVSFDIHAASSGMLCCDDCAKKLEKINFNNCVYFAWYRMPSGRYEITVYIS